MQQKIELISKRLNISESRVAGALQLLLDGATIPFIARYRKEATDGLDEVEIAAIYAENEKIDELIKRKAFVMEAIEAAGALTDELRARIEASWEVNEIEDIYLPYKQKKRTRATIAREAGLEPLAKIIMSGKCDDIESTATRYLNDKVATTEDATSGAQDIIAEWVSESEAARNAVRRLFDREAVITSHVVRGKEEEAANYRDYFEKLYRLSRCPSHALLAMRRGESEKLLKVNIEIDDDEAIERLERIFIKSDNKTADIISRAVKDGYKRLLAPSIETEFAKSSKEIADREATRIFANNLKQLLLAAPLGQKRTMGIDPGFRTGCKVVCLDAQGNLLYNDTIYPHPPKSETAMALKKISTLAEQYKIEAIAIGNGTAGRETEQFIQKVSFRTPPQVFVVSESGASIYSASAVAREEFPDYDVTVRGAVSIGRRLMDPLAELVKIDAKNIGVGQYQHDVDQTMLRQALDQTVETCVNSVGVEVNNASKQLLTYVAGVGPKLAQNIIDYRTENGGFKSRKELLKVAKMGAKTYEQCAGFIRVAASDNPLDRSAVHPERYALVERMAKDLGVKVEDLINNADLRKQIDINRYVSAEVGLPTLHDIMSELEKPGRDPRMQIEAWSFDPNIHTIDDLHEGMQLDGEVTNITNFGAFVNIGIKENGLLHISQISDRRISSIEEVLHINQHVKVRVLEIDRDRRRISLTMKN
ncbi:MAG: RNA-binding transcriptional accessory protein [Paludibacteraceae bacterium]|nr:RNA-binding transcriptional accessory protein [Paludibacteraceae bacterium]